MISYIISRMGDKKSVSIIGDGLNEIADSEHPNWDEIVERVTKEDFDGIAELFSLESTAIKAFEKLSERVAVRHGSVFFDGGEVTGPLADHLLRALREGVDVAPLVKFWENLANNPSKDSRESLFLWLESHNFTIDQDGMIVGYKGVRSDMRSVSSGPGIVNGVETNGNLDNTPGNVLEVDRKYVDPNPDHHCSRGLHVGTWSYASGFGPVVVEVRTNPRDVVAVPRDHNGEKMRTMRYKVERVLAGLTNWPTEGPHSASVLFDL